ncbi:MAG: 6-phosphogluconolactonase [Candidatus Tectimicrobiota bacterium]|nr:MAG: 6-phosphogluconolactonase [Candidatus Tectomicrobia bacterium]
MSAAFPSVAPEVRVCKDAAALARNVAAQCYRLACQAVAQAGRFTLVLAGGNTPRATYALLAAEPYRSAMPWAQTHVFWGDERVVPPQHPESNYRMAYETLLAHVAIPAANVHRIPAERGAEAAAADYERTVREFFGLQDTAWPHFDLILLGLGRDGHTASLFPGSPALYESRRLVVATWVPQLQAYRLTLTPPVLCQARHVLFVVSGRDKAAAVRRVLCGPYRPARYPAQLVRPSHGQLLWYLDDAAAAQLKGTGYFLPAAEN